MIREHVQRGAHAYESGRPDERTRGSGRCGRSRMSVLRAMAGSILAGEAA